MNVCTPCVLTIPRRPRVFRTSHDDVNINETSSYVDLAPLYGNNQETQDKIRQRNGRGELHPDVFAEDRLLLLPPAVCVILVLFNRNHNVSHLFHNRTNTGSVLNCEASSTLRTNCLKSMSVGRM